MFPLEENTFANILLVATFNLSEKRKYATITDILDEISTPPAAISLAAFALSSS